MCPHQVGSFEAGDNVSHMTCGRGIHNSITHQSAEPKESIEAEWRAPEEFEGSVTFTYSVLEEYDKYWVRMKADTVRVTR